MKFPALIAFSHVYLTGYPHTACIHLIACSVNGKSQTLLACCSALFMRLLGARGCQLPCCCINGMQYCPLSSLTPISIGVPLHVMRKSFSLCTVTPSLVKIDRLLLLQVLPRLISNVRKSWNVSACAASFDSCSNGTLVTCYLLRVSPLATPTCFVDCRSIGSFAFCLSFSLM